MSLPESKVRTCWWFGGDGHEAAAFYVSLLPDSRIGRVVERDGKPLVVEFTLAGAPMMILNAPPGAERTHAASIGVSTADQAETDRLWDALTANGGAAVACGWLTDRWGVSWQIVPRRLPEMLASDDRAAAERAFAAMQRMVKIDIAALEAAYRARRDDR
ncbi:VOC family protein [Salinarimonas chemoclinalis]|uniref:VOC family protein n=1 Tax=Salinarimonas chemoclinalis TaxID=3241599 RepID=UPI003556D787